jgi:MFS family permease
MKTFLIIWFGQLVSMLGSALTQFAIGVYVYQTTGSATQLSFVILVATLPRLIIAPFAGALVDRWDRRAVMIVSDTVAAITTLALWMLLAMGDLQVWHIALVVAVGAIAGIFQFPAYQAATTLLVAKEHFGRASGLNQLAGAIAQIASPLLAGFLIVTIQMQGIILIDFATFLFAMITLVFIRIPCPIATEEGRAARGSLWREAGYGLTYLRARPGLLGLLIIFAFVNFALGYTGVLMMPLVLSFASADVLGSILSFGGIGTLIGSLAMSAWGGSKQKINSLLGSIFLFSVFLIGMGARADAIVIAISAFGLFALLPIANASSQAIWQAKVAPDLQGRVFAIRAMIAQAITPITYLTAGPLADFIFEPLMKSENALGGMIGIGAGRGIGLMFILIGVFIAIATAIGYSISRIRNVETELPDFDVALSGGTK